MDLDTLIQYGWMKNFKLHNYRIIIPPEGQPLPEVVDWKCTECGSVRSVEQLPVLGEPGSLCHGPINWG